MKKSIQNIFQLTRLGLSLAIAFSSVAGQLLYAHRISSITFFTFLGVFLLSGGASALNQFQERVPDAQMGRTRNRPLPSGQIKPFQAVRIAAIAILIAILLLYLTTTWLALALGIFNLIWYNLVYTPLKRKSPFALLAGALTGAIPPMIGWCASGGKIFDPTILTVAVFMFLWQIPHFWLILLKYGKEYQAAGFGKLSTITFSGNIKSILFIWILSTSVSSLFFPYFHVIGSFYLILLLIGINVFLILYFYRFVLNPEYLGQLRSAFGTIYLYQVFVLTILILNAIVL